MFIENDNKNILQAIHARKIMLDENTDKLLRNTSMAKKKEVNNHTLLFVFGFGVICKTPRWRRRRR